MGKDPKILICGNYGATNLGDEAILDGILISIRRVSRNAQVTVLTYQPEETQKEHQIETAYFLPFGVRSLLRGIFKGEFFRTLKVIKNCDFFILGGGGLLTDEKLRAVFLWGIHVFAAHFFRKPIFIYANSLGPFRSFWGRKIARKVLKRAELITVRDQNSLKEAQSLGISKKLEFTADPAFLLEPKLPKNAQFELFQKSQPLVILSLRPWIKNLNKLVQVLPSFLDYLIDRYGAKIIGLPFQKIKDKDAKILNKIFTQMKNKKNVQILENYSNYRRVLKLIAEADLLIAMRLHALIFATLVGTPFLALDYSPKVRSFLNQIEQEELGIDLADLDLKKLKELLVKVWSNQEKISSALFQKRALLKKKAEENERYLKRFLS